MPFHPLPGPTAYSRRIPPDHDRSAHPPVDADIESRYPVVAIWRNIFQGIFSVLGRLASLAQFRDHHTRRYFHDKLAKALGPEQADNAMRIAHELVWRDWICGSLGQQRSDILLHLGALSSDIQHSITLWLQSEPF
jgi:hypothetical protein